MIKFVIVILVVAFATGTFATDYDELIALHSNFSNDKLVCANETGLTPGQYYDLIAYHVPKDKAPMCYLACLAKSFNLMDANNKFIKTEVDKLMEPIVAIWESRVKINPDVMEKIKKPIMEILNKCTDERYTETEEKDECVSATKVFECIVTKAKKVGVIREH